MIRGGAPELSDGAVRLREVTRGDAEDLYRWRMDERSRPMFRSVATVPFDAHRAFMDRYFTGGNTDHWFVIEAAGAPVGTITLYNLSADGHEAEWGRLVVDPDRRGHGYGQRALALLIAHARALGVRRLRCEVLESNAVAASLYTGAGFRTTGVDEAAGRRFVQLALDLRP
jgi:RimJ/RimL family protein N-acetyltransferase